MASSKKVAKDADPLLAEWRSGITPALQLRSIQVSNSMRRQVAEMREVLFGQPDRLLSQEEAAKWIAGEATCNPPSAEAKKKAQATHREIRQLARKYEQLTGGDYECSPRARLLRHPFAGRDKGPDHHRGTPLTPDGLSEVAHVAVRRGSKLDTLREFAERLAGKERCDSASVVAHVLCGEPLKLPETFVRVSWGATPVARVQFEIDASELNHRNLRKYYAKAKELLKSKVPGSGRGRMIESGQLELLDAVRRRREPPPKRRGKTEYWTRVKEELSWKPLSWQGVERRYQRLKDRFPELAFDAEEAERSPGGPPSPAT